MYDHLIEENGIYKDQISDNKLKSAAIEYFEKGNMPGYCITAHPYVDDDGPKFLIEFTPNNPMSINSIDILDIPDRFERVTCKLHPYYKDFLRFLSSESGISQDMLARSVLTRGLSLIIDQLK